MDKNRIDGPAKEARGSITEAIGKLTGDARTQAKGAAERNRGKVLADGKAHDAADVHLDD